MPILVPLRSGGGGSAGQSDGYWAYFQPIWSVPGEDDGLAFGNSAGWVWVVRVWPPHNN
jgi:hypothetical protein